MEIPFGIYFISQFFLAISFRGIASGEFFLLLLLFYFSHWIHSFIIHFCFLLLNTHIFTRTHLILLFHNCCCWHNLRSVQVRSLVSHITGWFVLILIFLIYIFFSHLIPAKCLIALWVSLFQMVLQGCGWYKHKHRIYIQHREHRDSF